VGCCANLDLKSCRFGMVISTEAFLARAQTEISRMAQKDQQKILKGGFPDARLFLLQ